MLAGWVTYEELKLITGFSDNFLNKLIANGLETKIVGKNTKDRLFNLQEVEEWLKVHLL